MEENFVRTEKDMYLKNTGILLLKEINIDYPDTCGNLATPGAVKNHFVRRRIL